MLLLHILIAEFFTTHLKKDPWNSKKITTLKLFSFERQQIVDSNNTSNEFSYLSVILLYLYLYLYIKLRQTVSQTYFGTKMTEHQNKKWKLTNSFAHLFPAFAIQLSIQSRHLTQIKCVCKFQPEFLLSTMAKTQSKYMSRSTM